MSSRIRSLLRPLAALTLASGVALGAAPVDASAGPVRATPVATDVAEATRHDRASLRLRLDRPEGRDVYVGEVLTGALEVLVRADTGATVRGAPRLDTPDVLLVDPPGELEQRDEVVGGVAYRVASFPVAVSAAVAGDLSLQATLPVELTWHELVQRKVQARRPRLLDQMLADDFFADDPVLREMLGQLEGMGGLDDVMPMEQTVAVERSESVELAIAPASLRARPLPTAGQPPGFGGAVGRFDVTSTLEPATVREGEPVTLTVTVAGEGNFDRLSWDGVPGSPQLTVYDPEAETTGDGEARRRVFRQTIVPRSAQVDTIPAATITSFDPDAGRYVTATAEPHAIEVLPAPTPSAVAPPSAAAADVEGAPVHATLRPPFVDRPFWMWQLAPLGAALSLAGAAAARARREATAPARARRERARQALATMRDAAGRGDAAAWLAAAFAALQDHVADDPDQAAALSPPEVATHLGERAAALAPLLDAVEASRYGGRPADALDVAQLHTLVQKEITS